MSGRAGRGWIGSLLMAAGMLAGDLPAAAASQGGSPGAAPPLRVSHQARAVAPGEAVLLTIRAAGPLVEVGGRAFGKAVVGYEGDTPAVWHALVGIDLETRPGRVRVEIEARSTDGSRLRATYPLTVARKGFPTRRLSVAPEFVTPPAAVQARIERERVRLAKVLEEVTPRPLWAGGFSPPTAGDVISRFGARSIFNGQARAPHRGVDLRGASGTPVVAPAGGTVALAEDLYFSGTTVVLDHGLGVHSILGHLSRIDVREGAAVAGSDGIGAIGATGRVTGPHLHWTLRIGSASVDPMSVMSVLGLPR